MGTIREGQLPPIQQYLQSDDDFIVPPPQTATEQHLPPRSEQVERVGGGIEAAPYS